MRFGELDIPEELVDAINEGNVVVFVGAGASKGAPTDLPNYEELVDEVAFGTGYMRDKDQACEVLLGKLKYAGINVHESVAKKLSGSQLRHNKLHENIVKLFPKEDTIRIVTTNYDVMLEQAMDEIGITGYNVYDAPALPLGDDVTGIVHIHGTVNNPKDMVVTDEDFGKAYILDGYAARFLIKLFETYTVLFIGYSYSDVIVRYLTRAMSHDVKCKKYAIISVADDEKGEKEVAKWKELGVHPICYEKDQHHILYNTIETLGVRICRGLLDWEISIKMISESSTYNLSIEEDLAFCLRDKSKVYLLTQYFHGKAWLEWFEQRGVFNNLFSEDVDLNDVDVIWMNWIFKEFFGKEDLEIKKLILKNNNKINKKFAERCVLELLRPQEEFNTVYLKEYIVLLENYITTPWHIYRLLDVVMERNLHGLGWTLFKKLFSYEMKLEDQPLAREEDAIKFKHHIQPSVINISEIWGMYEEEFSSKYPIRVLNFCMDYILCLHDKYVEVGMASNKSEPFEMMCATIEEQEDDYIREQELFVLSRMASSISERHYENESAYIKWYIEHCIKSESILLRRIGLKLLRESVLYSAADKQMLVRKYFSFHAVWEKSEIFKLIADVFDELEAVVQAEIIENIKSEAEADEDVRKAYTIFNWMVWLKRTCKANDLVRKTIDDILIIYPDFEERDEPEKNFSSISTWSGNISPLDEMEMLEMEIDDLIQLLKTYKGDQWEGPSRSGLLSTFSNCIKNNYVWATKVIKCALTEFEYDSDVWQQLLFGIQQCAFETSQLMEVLQLVCLDRMIEHNAIELSRIIEKILKSDNVKTNFSSYEEKLWQFSEQIWNKSDETQLSTDRLVDKCYNSTTGILTFNWILMLSYEGSKGVPIKYKELFERLLQDDKKDKMQIICVLVGQIRFFFAKDQEWCSLFLMPYLQSKSKEEFSAAWEGIAFYASQMYKELADELLKIYSLVLNRIGELREEVRRRFVYWFVVLLVHAVENPLGNYIPKFYKHASEEDRKEFISEIGHCLQRMNLDEKKKLWSAWLSTFWENRIKKIPEPLNETENMCMLEWLFELDELYPCAVEIIIQGTGVAHVDGLFWYRLGKENFAETYSHHTAKLITFLLNSSKHEGEAHFYFEDIINKLVLTDQTIKNNLREALIRKGMGEFMKE